MHNTDYDLVIASYPRSGSNYLIDYLRHGCGFIIEHTHGFDKGISIARDPLDSITSKITMYTHLPFYNLEFSEDVINDAIKNYEEMYKFALDNNEIYSYIDIVKDVKAVAKYIGNKYGKPLNDSFNGHSLENTGAPGFIKTSTNIKQYNNIKEIVSNKKILKCYNLYNLALQKSEKIF